MEDLKQIISKNIVSLRNSENMTQAELAEKLNYSDKAVSKWERGESLPDVIVIKQIADIFGVTVDSLLTDAEEAPKRATKRKKTNRRMITLVSVSGLWLIALMVFVILWIASHAVGNLWLTFIAAVPLTFILLLIFNSIWGKRKRNIFIISLLVWTLITFIYLLMLVCFGKNWFPLFFIGIPAEFAIIFAHNIKRK